MSIDALVRDVRFGARTLVRTPIVTVAGVLSIGLGIGASTTVFSVVDAALYRQPPFADAQRLTILYETHARPGHETELTRWSWPSFRMLASSTHSFAAIGSVSRSTLAPAMIPRL